MIFSIMKRLVVSRVFELNPSKKTEIFKIIFEKKIKECPDNQEMKDFLQKKLIKQEVLSYSQYENSVTEITEEICEDYILTNYTLIHDTLKDDAVFKNHICLTICSKLFKLLQRFAIVSFPFKLALSEMLQSLDHQVKKNKS